MRASRDTRREWVTCGNAFEASRTTTREPRKTLLNRRNGLACHWFISGKPRAANGFLATLRVCNVTLIKCAKPELLQRIKSGTQRSNICHQFSPEWALLTRLLRSALQAHSVVPGASWFHYLWSIAVLFSTRRLPLFSDPPSAQ